ncbi:hypothetical protein D3C75_1104510 [compost metagenome]
MRKAGYRPYGTSVVVKDRVCIEHNCFRQFTPTDESEVYCDQCFKAARQRIVEELKCMDKSTLIEISQKLLYAATSQKALLIIFKGKLV